MLITSKFKIVFNLHNISYTCTRTLSFSVTYPIRGSEAPIFNSPDCTEIQVSEGESGVLSPMYEPGLTSCYRILAAQVC